MYDSIALTFGSRVIKTVTEIHIEETRSVTRVDADGSFVLEIDCTRVWGTISGSSYKTAVTFDTAKSKRTHPAAKSYVKMLMRKTVVTVDRDYKVQSVCHRRTDGELGEPDSHAQQTRQLEFIRQPTLPMAVGARWRAPEGIHECKPGGCIELPTHNTLTGMDEKTISIATTAVEDSAKDKEPGTRIERSLKLSRRDGLTLTMKVSGWTRSPGSERVMRIETERVPTKADKAKRKQKREASKGPELGPIK